DRARGAARGAGPLDAPVPARLGRRGTGDRQRRPVAADVRDRRPLVRNLGRQRHAHAGAAEVEAAAGELEEVRVAVGIDVPAGPRADARRELGLGWGSARAVARRPACRGRRGRRGGGGGRDRRRGGGGRRGLGCGGCGGRRGRRRRGGGRLRRPCRLGGRRGRRRGGVGRGRRGGGRRRRGRAARGGRAAGRGGSRRGRRHLLAGIGIADTRADVPATPLVAASRGALLALDVAAIVVTVVLVLIRHAAADLARLRTGVVIAGATAGDHHAVPVVAPVCGEHLALVVVLLFVEDAAPYPVVVVVMVAVPVVIVALIAASVFVQCDRRLHPDGLPSRIDAERLVLPAWARAEAGPTVAC